MSFHGWYGQDDVAALRALKPTIGDKLQTATLESYIGRWCASCVLWRVPR